MIRFIIAFLMLTATCGAALPLPKGIELRPGPVNQVRLARTVAVYGWPVDRNSRVRHVLITHARRDVIWAAEPLLRRKVPGVAPAAERASLAEPDAFWKAWETARFHDYAQTSTKLPHRAVPIARYVRGGERVTLAGIVFEVVDTPGYTPGAVSYVTSIRGKRVAFTGDLIYGDGQLLDLYSLQDAVPEAKARGYHGYAARAGDLIASLRKVAALKPDILIPARGPVIHEPQAAIGKLIQRLQALLQSHYSTDALLWYWGPDNLRIRSGKALEGARVNSMAMAEQKPLPPWVIPIGNSRLIVSKSGAAFLVDAGYSRILEELKALQQQGRFTTLEGIWVTHYHDDHTDHVQRISEAFKAPVHFTARMQDILEHPSRFRMPCLTANPITGQPEPDGAGRNWREFQLTFRYLPGQTLYHGALAVRHESEGTLVFVGDSFTPSGMDDYCLQNRNFLHEGEGFRYSLDLLVRLDPNHWLINQHVLPMFRFSGDQIVRMQQELRQRESVVKELSPWPDANYAVDESWARIYPYGVEAAAGESLNFELRLTNHSATEQVFQVRWNLPAGVRQLSTEPSVTVPARSEGRTIVRVLASQPGLHLLTADIQFGGHSVREWTEALIRIK